MEIKTYVTVFIEEAGPEYKTPAERGFISQQRIHKQMELLNEAYEPAGFYFTLQRLVNMMQPSWFGNETILNATRRESLQTLAHQGAYSDLNLVFMNDLLLEKGVLGQTQLPRPTYEDDGGFYTDGPIMLSHSAPEIVNGEWTTGKTVIHEVGHWFGLGHPDKDECNKQNYRCCVAGKPLFEVEEPRKAWSNYMFPWMTSKNQTFTRGQVDYMRQEYVRLRLPDVRIKNQRFDHLMAKLPRP
ncbi:hypothetical protein CDD80_2866 [Ophiocordyceps camponoti-rufipedis]|uniref:Peptidase M43 pregnancy-associated plasma-A domain-containing protein n=1 Tax=Ophiocordyceps camponoti-rufipedis TaxID=2004952 RepID=A0A2C5Z4G8_9HYPO|nr:hypothetical protein CDD80_2866 [Ophiocordyceps camponoti-rufipedis]